MSNHLRRAAAPRRRFHRTRAFVTPVLKLSLLFVLLPALASTSEAQQQARQPLYFPVTDRLPSPGSPFAAAPVHAGDSRQQQPQQPQQSQQPQQQSQQQQQQQQQKAREEQQAEEEEFVKPSRPTLANPAEFQKPGVLEVEYGYDADFRGEDFDVQQTTPLAIRFAAGRRLLLELNSEGIKSETDLGGERVTGIGDTQIGFQVVAAADTGQHPALAFAYYLKLPTASRSKGLGSGRFDHKLLFLVSRKLGETDVDFNGAYLAAGREEGGGWLHGGQAALSFGHDLTEKLNLQWELSGQSVDEAQPRGLYALGALAYKVHRRLVLDWGARFGLNPEAPRVGAFAGLSVGVVDFFRRSR